MNLNSKLNMNQKVWNIEKKKESYWEECVLCDAKGRIDIPEKNRCILCSDCDGRKGKTIWKNNLIWEVDNCLTIGLIRVEISNITPTGRFANMGEYIEGKNILKVIYMAYETGIGSGHILKEENLFPSLEEARDECERRNNEKPM